MAALISIHALREEGDSTAQENAKFDTLFLSTPSARRATCNGGVGMSYICLFLSTPSARRATGNDTDYKRWAKISIHALREEGDVSR